MVDALDCQNNYLNIVIKNNGGSTATAKCVYSQQLNEPYLKRADEWKLAIVRFALPIQSLPYFTVASGTYWISLQWRGVNYSLPVPAISSSVLQPSNIYFISQWLDSINAVLATEYASVIAANPTDYMLIASHSPYFTFDPVTNLMSLNTDTGVWDQNSVGSGKVIANTALAALFSSMPSILLAYNSVSHIDSQFNIVTRSNNSAVQPLVPFAASNQTYAKNAGSETTFTSTAIPFALPVGAVLQDQNSSVLFQNITLTAAAAAGTTALTVAAFVPAFAIAPGDKLLYQPPNITSTTDEAPSVVAWFTAYSVAVVSRQMPTRPENIPAFTLSGGNTDAQFNSLSQQSILADFLFPQEERLSGTASLVYIPVAQYRFVDLISDGSLSFIDLSFYWSDSNGNLSLIDLQPGEVGSIKLLWTRKHEHVVVEERSGGDLRKRTFDGIREEQNSKRMRLY